MFPYVVEYAADQEFGGGVCVNSAEKQSEEGARDLFGLLTQSPRVRWARWYKVGMPGNLNEFWRS